jgi:hypothetical protein
VATMPNKLELAKRGSWLFDPNTFHAWLIPQIIHDGRLQLDSLRNLVQKVSDVSRVADRIYLEMIGLGDEDFADDELTHQDKLYAASMAGHLKEGPTADHILLVEPLLSVADWASEEIRSVVHGDKLATLVKSSGSEVLTDQVGVHLNDRRYGGWFSVERAQELMTKLTGLEHLFRNPSRSVLDRYSPDLDDARVRSLLLTSFQEATAPLRTSVQQGLAMRLVDRY